jgi:hypothetical protein
LTRTVLPASQLHQSIWRFGFGDTEDNHGSRRKLKDICKIHVGITTLCDRAYIVRLVSGTNANAPIVAVDTKLKGRVLLERDVLRPIVKGSTLKSSSDPITEQVIFPYEKVNGKHRIIAESCLSERFPLAYAYLQSVRPELEKRDNGKPNAVAWYAFGRSQSLDTSWGPKIIFAPLSDRPRFVFYPHPDCTVYSGYFLKYDGDMDTLLSELNSDRMARFVSEGSRDFRGAWKAYSKKVIEDFEV